MTHDEAWVQAQAERAAFRSKLEAMMSKMLRDAAADLHLDPESIYFGPPPDLADGGRAVPQAFIDDARAKGLLPEPEDLPADCSDDCHCSCHSPV